MRRLMLALPLLLAACQQEATKTYAPPPTDMTPVGGGLSVIGLGLVVAAVVLAIKEVLGGSGKGGRHG